MENQALEWIHSKSNTKESILKDLKLFARDGFEPSQLEELFNARVSLSSTTPTTFLDTLASVNPEEVGCFKLSTRTKLAKSRFWSNCIIFCIDCENTMQK